jgi:hypothetical protein
VALQRVEGESVRERRVPSKEVARRRSGGEKVGVEVEVEEEEGGDPLGEMSSQGSTGGVGGAPLPLPLPSKIAVGDGAGDGAGAVAGAGGDFSAI